MLIMGCFLSKGLTGKDYINVNELNPPKDDTTFNPKHLRH